MPVLLSVAGIALVGAVIVVLVWWAMAGEGSSKAEAPTETPSSVSTQGREQDASGTGETPAAKASAGAETGPGPPLPTGLAVPVGERFRAAGFDPTLLQSFSTRAGGPDDGVLVGLRGIDREEARRVLDLSLALFQEELGDRRPTSEPRGNPDADDDGTPLPELARLSLVVRDAADGVHKEELRRAEALRAAVDPQARADLESRWTLQAYPAPPEEATEPAPPGGEEGEPSAGRARSPAGGRGDGPLGTEDEGAETIRFRPEKAQVDVLRLLVISRFPEAEVTVEGEEVVVEVSAEEAQAVRLYLRDVDSRPGSRARPPAS